MYTGLKSHTALERMQARFDRSGANTSEVAFSLGGTLFATIEPENLKSILSLRFKGWGLGNERKQVMISFLGEGLLETDGGMSVFYLVVLLRVGYVVLSTKYILGGEDSPYSSFGRWYWP